MFRKVSQVDSTDSAIKDGQNAGLKLDYQKTHIVRGLLLSIGAHLGRDALLPGAMIRIVTHFSFLFCC